VRTTVLTSWTCSCQIFRFERTDGEVRPRSARVAHALSSGRHARSLRPRLVIGAYEIRYTTKQPNAHNTESRKLLYPWHPWHGRSVWVHRTMVRNDIANSYGSLDKATAARLLEIPQWMFDATACYGMHLAPIPAISIEAILDLKRLLAQVTSDSHDANISLPHRSTEAQRELKRLHNELAKAFIPFPHAVMRTSK